MIKCINWEFIHLSLQQWEKLLIYMYMLFIYLYLFIIIYRAIFTCLHYFFQIWLRIAHETQHIAWSTVYINMMSFFWINLIFLNWRGKITNISTESYIHLTVMIYTFIGINNHPKRMFNNGNQKLLCNGDELVSFSQELLTLCSRTKIIIIRCQWALDIFLLFIILNSIHNDTAYYKHLLSAARL